jgi:8-oxo-dGTP pyrophosphatase MutT (NUDIX family)
MPRILATAGLLHLHEGKLLLAYSRNKQAWYLPGGKVDEGETAKEALLREIKEELNRELIPDHLVYHSHIQALAYGEVPPRTMEQDCFLYLHPLAAEPSSEIEALRYFSMADYALEEVQVEGVVAVMRLLFDEGLLVAH